MVSTSISLWAARALQRSKKYSTANLPNGLMKPGPSLCNEHVDLSPKRHKNPPQIFAEKTLILMVLVHRSVGRTLWGGQCRFSPSCSEYALVAISEWGPLKGLWLSLKRLIKCQPFGAYGLDPAPRRTDGGLKGG